MRWRGDCGSEMGALRVRAGAHEGAHARVGKVQTGESA